MRRLVPALATACVALLLVIGPNALAQTAPSVVVMQPGSYYDPANCVGVQLAGGLYLCGVAPTPIPTDTATPAPTSTATPTATAIPPTATVVVINPTATPVPPITAINGTPLCGVQQPNGQTYGPAHDPTKWHPLTVNNPDGSVLCTYGHEHGMDPSQLDSVLGPLPLAQQISYPWATVSATGVQENSTANKHRVYKWVEAQGMQCVSNNQLDSSARVVTAFREELHADGNLGATVRFHSYWGQYQITDCSNPANTGLIQVGGHMDYADLIAGPSSLQIPLPGVDASVGCAINGDSRHEGLPGAVVQNGVWYGANARGQLAGQPVCDDANPSTALGVGVQVNVTVNSFGPVDPTDPKNLLFYPNLAEHDETHINTDALTLWIGNGYLWKQAGYMDASGHINFTGHVNRHGAVVPEVAGQVESIDYIPLVIKNAEPGGYAGWGVLPCVGNLQHCPVTYSGDVAGPNGANGFYVSVPS